jgi:type I site-specific restriction endonuclease
MTFSAQERWDFMVQFFIAVTPPCADGWTVVAGTSSMLTEKNTDGRVYVSTYPTMMGLINELDDGRRRFGPGHFDLVVIDEAHRSVYQKYGRIFEYFGAGIH